MLPEWLSPELVLGIVGTVTGVASLVIYFIRLQRENPIIKTEVIECRHYLKREKDQPIFCLELELRVKNIGHQGTTLTKMETSFIANGKRHSIHEEWFWSKAQWLSLTQPRLLTTNLWIDPHRTMEIRCNFQLKGEAITQENLDCLFFLHHTHGKEPFKVTSPFPPSE